jgi:hypothetical protein
MKIQVKSRDVEVTSNGSHIKGKLEGGNLKVEGYNFDTVGEEEMSVMAKLFARFLLRSKKVDNLKCKG